jgi:hypothetical protein
MDHYEVLISIYAISIFPDEHVVNDMQNDYATIHTAAIDISADVDRTPQAWWRTV